MTDEDETPESASEVFESVTDEMVEGDFRTPREAEGKATLTMF